MAITLNFFVTHLNRLFIFKNIRFWKLSESDTLLGRNVSFPVEKILSTAGLDSSLVLCFMK
jgi:hypothetical protein